jgi:hypothetical protein
MKEEVTQEVVMRALQATYPNVQRGMWRTRVIDALCGELSDPDESDNLRESIMGLRYEPDAFVIEKDLGELIFFEVEVYSLLKQKKLQAYAAFSMELAGYIKFALLTVNKHGHINAIDLLPYYADWLKENAP